MLQVQVQEALQQSSLQLHFGGRAPSPYNEDDADIEGQFQCCERFVVFGFQLGHSNRLDVSIRTGCSEQAIPAGFKGHLLQPFFESLEIVEAFCRVHFCVDQTRRGITLAMLQSC